jgi:hypothetical protein
MITMDAHETAHHEFTIENNFMLGVVLFIHGQRCKNWCATIKRDQSMPCGMRRTGHDLRTAENPGYSVKKMKLGDCMEWASDYFTLHGFKKPNRAYTVTVGLTTERILLIEFPTSAQAFEAQAALIAHRYADVEQIIL